MALLTDPTAIAGLVTREVRSGTRDGAPTRIAVARRTYPTDRGDLWDALTDAERLPRWFLPVSGDLRVGGRYQLEGNAGGVVERCDEPESFAVTWEMGPQMSWLEITLSVDGAGTRLELVHEAQVDPEFWTQYGPGAVGVGWDLALMGLGLHLASGEPVDPAAGLEFPTTPEGIAFVRTAATGWAEAAAADGDEPIAAHTAAEQTIVFYTTVPEEGSDS
ncbi:SRPBCC family protein [Nocardia bovistercoris]|uniref:SRPBCC family protein n=1 Tax=Nocardia bovistercoris TaxID=2785916 RepID=A0A931IIX5_9NOCA|nr:SRPBCC family protein [Nocardia bovistercoris]MBH0781156.1 SRPBCC family protein [Nocardia bovistercoris]